jgi:hypothetical protein
LLFSYKQKRLFQWSNRQSAVNLAHNPADISQASSAFGILGCALTGAEFFFGLNFFHNQRPAVFFKISLDVFDGIPKAVTNDVFHFFIP